MTNDTLPAKSDPRPPHIRQAEAAAETSRPAMIREAAAAMLAGSKRASVEADLDAKYGVKIDAHETTEKATQRIERDALLARFDVFGGANGEFMPMRLAQLLEAEYGRSDLAAAKVNIAKLLGDRWTQRRRDEVVTLIQDAG